MRPTDSPDGRRVKERLHGVRLNIRQLRYYSRGWTTQPYAAPFVLFGLMRSGTTLLGDLLAQNSDLTWLGEAFDQRMYFPILYLAGVANCAPTRFIGMKIFSFQLSKHTEPPTSGYDAAAVDRGRRIVNRLRSLNWKFIHLVRDDLFAQTVSFTRANQTGVWHKAVGAEPSNNVQLRLSVHKFEKNLKIFMIYREYEAKVLADVEILRLTYEICIGKWRKPSGNG